MPRSNRFSGGVLLAFRDLGVAGRGPCPWSPRRGGVRRRKLNDPGPVRLRPRLRQGAPVRRPAARLVPRVQLQTTRITETYDLEAYREGLPPGAPPMGTLGGDNRIRLLAAGDELRTRAGTRVVWFGCKKEC